jgi:tetraacyldisaccharide 4'-kinase
MRVRNFLYDQGIFRQVKLKIPVISIGNITMGGSGKTPVIMLLATELKKKGKNVYVVARAYPHSVAKPKLVSKVRQMADQFGDEASLIYLSTDIPVVVSNSKTESALFAEKLGAEVVLIDDGFQHRRLYRDLDVVLINGEQSEDQSRMFPVGYARESLASLKRADFVLMTKKKTNFTNIQAHGFVSSAKIKFCYGLGGPEMKVHSAVLVSAIAHNESFATLVKQQGVVVHEHFEFSDHHDFSPHDLDSVLLSAVRHGAQCVLCTEKDAVKLVELWKASVPLVTARLTVEFGDGKEEFHAAVDRLFP